MLWVADWKFENPQYEWQMYREEEAMRGHKQLKKSEPNPDLGLPLINYKGLHQKMMTVLEWAP